MDNFLDGYDKSEDEIDSKGTKKDPYGNQNDQAYYDESELEECLLQSASSPSARHLGRPLKRRRMCVIEMEIIGVVFVA